MPIDYDKLAQQFGGVAEEDDLDRLAKSMGGVSVPQVAAPPSREQLRAQAFAKTPAQLQKEIRQQQVGEENVAQASWLPTIGTGGAMAVRTAGSMIPGAPVVSEPLAQLYENVAGTRVGFNPYLAAGETGLSLIPGGKLAAPIARGLSRAAAPVVSAVPRLAPLAGRIPGVANVAERALFGEAATAMPALIEGQPYTPGAGAATALGIGAAAKGISAARTGWKTYQGAQVGNRIKAGLGISDTDARGLAAVDESLSPLRAGTKAKVPFTNTQSMAGFVKGHNQKFFERYHEVLADANAKLPVTYMGKQTDLSTVVADRTRLNTKLDNYLSQDRATQAVMEEINPTLKAEVAQLKEARRVINESIDTVAPQSASQAEIMKTFSHLKELEDITTARAAQLKAIKEIAKGSKLPISEVAKDFILNKLTLGMMPGAQIPTKTLAALRRGLSGPRVDPDKLIRIAGKKFKHVKPAEEIVRLPSKQKALPAMGETGEPSIGDLQYRMPEDRAAAKAARQRAEGSRLLTGQTAEEFAARPAPGEPTPLQPGEMELSPGQIPSRPTAARPSPITIGPAPDLRVQGMAPAEPRIGIPMEQTFPDIGPPDPRTALLRNAGGGIRYEPRAAPPPISGGAPVIEPVPTPNVSTGLAQYRTRMEQEASGQHILDTLESTGKTPQSVVQEFWANTFPSLPEQGKATIQAYIKNLTQMEPGSVVSVDAAGNTVRASNWSDIYPASQAAGSVEYLQGPERGLISLMEMANQKVGTSASRAGAAPAIGAAPPVIEPVPQPPFGQQTGYTTTESLVPMTPERQAMWNVTESQLQSISPERRRGGERRSSVEQEHQRLGERRAPVPEAPLSERREKRERLREPLRQEKAKAIFSRMQEKGEGFPLLQTRSRERGSTTLGPKKPTSAGAVDTVGTRGNYVIGPDGQAAHIGNIIHESWATRNIGKGGISQALKEGWTRVISRNDGLSLEVDAASPSWKRRLKTALQKTDVSNPSVPVTLEISGRGGNLSTTFDTVEAAREFLNSPKADAWGDKMHRMSAGLSRTTGAAEKPTIAPVPEPKVGSAAKAPQSAKVLTEMTAIEPRGEVSIARLRERFPDLSKEEFDKMLLDLEQKDVVYLSRYSGASSIPPDAEKNAMIHRKIRGDDVWFHGVARIER